MLLINAVNAAGCPVELFVKDGKIVARGSNSVTLLNDPTAHAEMTAIRAACSAMKVFRLEGCELYTSCEPCSMCLSAAYWAGYPGIYYGQQPGGMPQRSVSGMRLSTTKSSSPRRGAAFRARVCCAVKRSRHSACGGKSPIRSNTECFRGSLWIGLKQSRLVQHDQLFDDLVVAFGVIGAFRFAPNRRAMLCQKNARNPPRSCLTRS